MAKYQFFFATSRYGDIFVDSRYQTPPIDIDTPADARALTIVLAVVFNTNCQCFDVQSNGSRSFYFECLINEK